MLVLLEARVKKSWEIRFPVIYLGEKAVGCDIGCMSVLGLLNRAIILETKSL